MIDPSDKVTGDLLARRPKPHIFAAGRGWCCCSTPVERVGSDWVRYPVFETAWAKDKRAAYDLWRGRFDWARSL